MKLLKIVLLTVLFLVLISCQPTAQQQLSSVTVSEPNTQSEPIQPPESASESEDPIYYLSENPYGDINLPALTAPLYPSPVESELMPIPEFKLNDGRWSNYRLVFPADQGTAVTSVCPGTVVMVQNKRPPEMDEEEQQTAMLGKYAVVWIGDGLSIRYAHLSEVTVEEGQVLELGDQIGTVGYTGVALLQSRQPICGIYLLKDGIQIDPLAYFEMPSEFQIYQPLKRMEE